MTTDFVALDRADIVLGAQWRATSAFFLFNGVTFSTWATEVPRLKLALGLDALQISWALLALTVGTVIVLPVVCPAISRFGIPRVTAVAAGAAAFTLLLVPQAGDIYALSLLMLAFGACFGALDVALNNAGILLEAHARRPLMSGLHAMYSAGGLLGALVGGALIWAGATPAQHFALLLPAALALVFWLAPALPMEARCEADPADAVGARGRRWPWPVALLGLFAACAAFGEGATGDWAGIYLKETVLSPAGVEALGFAAFSLTMLGGRLCGDRLSERFGPVALGRAAALTAALGGLLVIGLPQVAPVLAGFALMGLGLSVLAPLAFSAIGRVAPQDPKPAIALVTALFYFGYVVSPPLIGVIAEISTLRIALSSMALSALAAAALTFMLGRAEQPSTGP